MILGLKVSLFNSSLTTKMWHQRWFHYNASLSSFGRGINYVGHLLKGLQNQIIMFSVLLSSNTHESNILLACKPMSPANLIVLWSRFTHTLIRLSPKSSKWIFETFLQTQRHSDFITVAVFSFRTHIPLCRLQFLTTSSKKKKYIQ